MSGWRLLPPALRHLGAEAVRLSFDADARTNPLVAQPLYELASLLREEKALAIELETWDIADGKGIDDLLAAGNSPTVLTGDDVWLALDEIVKAAREARPERATAVGESGKPSIEVTTEEENINSRVIDALQMDDTLFQRGGCLVHVVRDLADKTEGIGRDPSTPRIVLLPLATLRERISSAVEFMDYRGSGQNRALVPVHPPKWCVAAVAGRGQWNRIRRLEGVVDAPILLPDGSILTTPGYHADTGLLFQPSIEIPPFRI